MTIITTCPQCDTKFNLTADILGDTGKRVRCTKCKHDWFQEPPEADAKDEDVFEVDVEMEGPHAADNQTANNEADEGETDTTDATQEAAEEPKEDNTEDTIPESVKPSAEDDDIIPPPTKKTTSLKSRKSIIGFAASLLVLIIIIIISVLLKPVLTKNKIGANSYFSAIGLKPSVPGDGVKFSDVVARFEAGSVQVSGVLLNIKNKETILPYMILQQLDDDNKIISSVMVEPPVSAMKAAGVEDFHLQYPASEGAVSVKLSFTLKQAQQQEPEHEEDNHPKVKSKAKPTPEQTHPPADHHNPDAH